MYLGHSEEYEYTQGKRKCKCSIEKFERQPSESQETYLVRSFSFYMTLTNREEEEIRTTSQKKDVLLQTSSFLKHFVGTSNKLTN